MNTKIHTYIERRQIYVLSFDPVLKVRLAVAGRRHSGIGSQSINKQVTKNSVRYMLTQVEW